MRTIPNIGSMLQPLENAIRNQLIPALTEQMQMSEQERSLIALPVRLGGLGIPNPCKEAQHDFENSVKLTKNLADAIINQSSAAADNTENRSLVSKANRIRQTNMKDEVEQAGVAEETASTQSAKSTTRAKPALLLHFFAHNVVCTNSGYFMLKRLSECTIPIFWSNFSEKLAFGFKNVRFLCGSL